MKLKFSVIVFALAVASLAALGIFAPSAASFESNQSFEMVTLYGDPTVLDGFSLQGMVRTGPDDFARVTWKAGVFAIEETVFDTRNLVNGFQLENRELFRNFSQWNTSEIDTDTHFVRINLDGMSGWNREEASIRVAVLDKNTHTIRNEAIEVPDIHRFETFWQAGTAYIDGNIYIVLQSDGNGSEMRVYDLNPTSFTLTRTYTYNLPIHPNSWVSVQVFGEYVYFSEWGEGEISRIHLVTQEESTFEVDNFRGLVGEWTNNSLIFADNTPLNAMHVLNLETGETIPLEDPEFFKNYNTEMGDWIQLSGNLQTVGDHLIAQYIGERSGQLRTHYYVVRDVNTGDVQFIGSIAMRNDYRFVDTWQGLSVVAN
ncbi:MAG: hypothetical protein FWF59_06555 [Turicibacter sp.]|nr:hypothetical protein [Turicibacter sp.]